MDGRVSETPNHKEKTREAVAAQVLLEDYKLWLRELEKQDRWLYQGIWTVLAASAGALFVIHGAGERIRLPAAFSIGVVALAFIVINGDVLATRVSSYRMVSRRVAGLRKVARVYEILGEEAYRLSGVPMLSDNPSAFTRNAISGRARSYRSLLLLHLVALLIVFGLLAVFLRFQGASDRAVVATLATGLITYAWFAVRVRYRASEAESIASFLVTLARDQSVNVASDAEERLGSWMRDATDTSLLGRCQRVTKVMVAYEDRRFWWHPGLDLVAVAGRILGRRARGGASTIAMQLARQVVPNPLRARVRRKVFEIVLCCWLVLRYGRRRVLTAWLTRAQYGRSSIVGLVNAADRYFGKRPEELDELDALLLAERVTVYTGRYYTDRVDRLAAWALRRGLITETQKQDAAARYAAMQKRVPT
jgi:hypothetical protein